jgi:hypothetical protein
MRLVILLLVIMSSPANASVGMEVLGGKTCDTTFAYADGLNPLGYSQEFAEQTRREVLAYFVGVADASTLPGVSSVFNLEMWRLLCDGQGYRVWKFEREEGERSVNFWAPSLCSWSGFDVFRPLRDETDPNAIPLM